MSLFEGEKAPPGSVGVTALLNLKEIGKWVDSKGSGGRPGKEKGSKSPERLLGGVRGVKQVFQTGEKTNRRNPVRQCCSDSTRRVSSS